VTFAIELSQRAEKSTNPSIKPLGSSVSATGQNKRREAAQEHARTAAPFAFPHIVEPRHHGKAHHSSTDCRIPGRRQDDCAANPQWHSGGQLKLKLRLPPILRTFYWSESQPSKAHRSVLCAGYDPTCRLSTCNNNTVLRFLWRHFK